jgi:phosphonatase-like hydrolase
LSAIKLVIFDIAGTLIEDHDEVTESFLLALRNHGITASESEIKEWKGSSKREVIAHFVKRQFGRCGNEALVEQTYAGFQYLIEQRYAQGSVIPITGSADTLSWLREHEIKIATTTGFYRALRDSILHAAGWQNTFDTNVCSDDVAHGRPAPDMIFRAMELTSVTAPERVLNVGDTPLDLQSAASAKVRWSVGVLTGKHTAERLHREPHANILPSVAAIPALLQQLAR